MASHIASAERPNFLVSVLSYVTCVCVGAVFEFISRTALILSFFSVYRAFLVTDI